MAKGNNLANYEKLATPPKEAVVPITGGSKGAAKLSSIKAQWRIKILTEVYGEYGVGWYLEEEESIFPIPDTGIVEVFTVCKLYVRDADGWRPPAVGKGQTHLVSQTKNGLFVDDEARKKALTDAFGNAAKYYGVGGDIYMGKSVEEDNKYVQPSQRQVEQQVRQKCKPIAPKLKDNEPITPEQVDHLIGALDKNHRKVSDLLSWLNGLDERVENKIDDINQLTYAEYVKVITTLNV